MGRSSAKGSDGEARSEVAEEAEAKSRRCLDKWAKWTRKLLDHKFLQGYWSDLGHYLAYIKAQKRSRWVLL